MHRIDAIIFQVSFYDIFVAQFGSANWSFASIHNLFRKAVNGHTVYVTKEGGQWAYGVRDQGRRSMGIGDRVLECCLVELSCSVV